VATFEYLPAVQLVQLEEPSREDLPAAQTEHELEPGAAAFPASHLEQLLAPALFEKRPASQLEQLVAADKLPASTPHRSEMFFSQDTTTRRT